MWISYPVREFIKITEIYSLFECPYNKNYEFKGESHDFWECLYVVDGSICVSADERIYEMKKGSIIFHKPLELHKFYVTSQSDTRVFVFSFSMEGETNFFEDKVFSLNIEQKILINSFLSFLNSKKHSEHSYELFVKPFNSSEIYSQQVVSYIYLLLLSIYNNDTNFSIAKTEDALIFSEAVTYMNNDLAKTPAVAEIAYYSKTSESTLKRIFNKFAGMSVHNYLLTIKINMSIQMLKEGISVIEIADKLGFNTQAYFSYVFKRELGVSPTEYRKRGCCVKTAVKAKRNDSNS